MTFICWRNPDHTQISTTIFGWPTCGECGAAPPYHERSAYLPGDFALGLYVPRPPTSIAQGSGVVGLPDDGGDEDFTEVYYEGFIFGHRDGDDPLTRWKDACLIAADRMVTRYPTIARSHLPSDSLEYVGLLFPKSSNIVIDKPEPLQWWLGVETGVPS